MAGSLPPGVVEQYRRQGYYFPIRVLSTAEAAEARQRLEAAQAAGGPARDRHFYKLHLLYPFLYDLVRHPVILDAVEAAIGSDILVWASGLFIKEGPSPHVVHWHQDAIHFSLEPAEEVTAWVALTDSDASNGCLRVIGGSHLGGVLTHREVDSHPGTMFRGSEAGDVDERLAVDVVLQAGEMSLHHLRLVHGSLANRSNRRRVGYAIRFIPPHVRQRRPLPDSALLVRGTDRYGHFLPEAPPVDASDRATLVRYEAAMQRRQALVFTATEGILAPAAGAD
jgi:non-heme Fe2+,alpha-ketoglutarate-dependent halogenase